VTARRGAPPAAPFQGAILRVARTQGGVRCAHLPWADLPRALRAGLRRRSCDVTGDDLERRPTHCNERRSPTRPVA
jgi:hypothetical protein